MSTQITTAFVEQYRSNVDHLVQQMDSRFQGKVRQEGQRGKTKFWEQLGATAAVQRTTRHADTPRVDSNHQRRANYLLDYEWSDLIDTADEVKMLIDPTSPYAQSAAMAMNRAKDTEVIRAASAAAYADTGGGNGAVSSTALPSTQKVAVGFVASGTTANSGLTLAKLIETKSILGKNEVARGETLYFAYSQQQLDDLLINVSQVSSSDYAAVKALVDGEVNYFMGFEFIKTQLTTLTSSTDVRTCFGYAKSGLLLAIGTDSKGRVSERDDKSYSVQVYNCMSIGSTRMEEKKVVEVMCDESP